METISVKTHSRTELVDITPEVHNAVKKSGLKDGIICVYAPHTTAAVTINENADPSVQRDVLKEVNKIIPFDDNYSHTEGNAAGHIKSSVIGPSEMIIVENGKIVLGTWQGIYFCEFDGPRTRKVFVKAVSTR